MLSPALNIPELTKVDPGPAGVGPTAPATYGALMHSAREALDEAIGLANQSPPGGENPLQELLGYERFLHGAGGHLRQLTTLADLRTDALRRLTNRLNQRALPEVEDSTWLRAATGINTAQDLVATHLLDGAPRTIEAEELILGPAAAGASRELIRMILDAVEGSRQLMHRVARAQQHRQGRSLIPGKMFAHLNATNHAVSLCARATMYDLTQLPTGAGRPLDHLQAALPTELTAAPTPIQGPLAALRVLRQLSHEQARGLTAASPASLRDLALLGAKITTTAVLPATGTDRPLTRLQRAHAEDHLDTANTAWLAASTELTTTVQGLTRAPGAYGVAIHTLLDEPLDQRTQSALLTALPSLGRDAARTVQTLARRGGLVTPQRIPLQTRTAWRPINDEQVAVLTERFGTAALTSSRALATVRELQRTTAASADQPRRDRVRPQQLLQSREQQVLSQ